MRKLKILKKFFNEFEIVNFYICNFPFEVVTVHKKDSVRLYSQLT